MTHLPYLAAARVSGEDAATFLQAQLSADILGLAPSDATFACYCSPRGQVLGLLLVGRRAEDFVVVASAALLPGLLERLGRFVLRARVRLEAAADLRCFGLSGPPAAAFEGTLLRPGAVSGCYAVCDAVAESSGDPGEWKASELRRGIAWLDQATGERFIPQMLGFDALGAVSFTKGCYPGQEIVARARYLGQVKRGPLRLALREPALLPAGTPARLVGADEPVDATVVDSAIGGDGGAVVLLVAPLATGPVTAVEAGGLRYGCATM